MSSLIFCTEAHQALIATDTLATSAPEARPLKFTTKAHILPHLRLVIAGTGAGGVLDKWLARINGGIVVRDVDDLNEHTQGNLTDVWSEWAKDFPVKVETRTATIYHFGFSEGTGLIHSYAYKSEGGFERILIPYGMHTKPECSIPMGTELPQDLKMLMDKQRTLQLALPKEQQVHIGGEIQVIRLMQDGFTVSTQTRFDDYEETERLIYAPFQ